jgi:DNA (cytosine-5)-methyltransferase 1
VRSIELFAGAGGLAIGVAKAGFEHAAVLEWDHDACQTMRANQRRGVREVIGWPVIECDAKKFSYESLQREITIVAGGPPCQPFSLGGKHRAHKDERDLFPEATRAVRELRPKAFILENVKGLMRQSFASYFEYIILTLSYPELLRKKGEDWQDHRARLEQHQTANARRQPSGLTYNVVFQLLNAADYGVPQRRERVFIVGFRADLGIQWSFPTASHSQDSLIRDQWITGEYWDRHEVTKRNRPEMNTRVATRVEGLKALDLPLEITAPWRTVRDAISDLPDPERRSITGILNHSFNPGARSYLGHTGSPLDEPAKTLKAGDHGVPGGENMLLRQDGSVRYFTVREAARLQTFPDDYEFFGAWSETMRQLGNAVPVTLAEAVARSVAATLG